MEKKFFCLLEDLTEVEKRAGGNIVKYTVYSKEGYKMKVKIYNKFVSQLQAGDTQVKVGLFLFNTLYNPKHTYLSKLFNNPDVEKYGTSRIEVSVYGSGIRGDYEKLIQSQFNLIKNKKIFYEQPLSQQYTNMFKNVTKTALYIDETNGEFLMCWGGSYTTRRVIGVHYKISTKKFNGLTEIQKKELIKKIKIEMMTFYNFNNTPCYCVKTKTFINENGEECIEIKANGCYMRKGFTYLTPTNKPTTTFLGKENNMPDIERLYPHLPHLQFKFITKKMETMGKNKIDGGEQKKPLKMDGKDFKPIIVSTQKQKESTFNKFEYERDQKSKAYLQKLLAEMEKRIKEERLKERERTAHERREIEKYIKMCDRADERAKIAEEKLNFNYLPVKSNEIKNELRQIKYVNLFGFKSTPTQIKIIYDYEIKGEKEIGAFFANGGELKSFLNDEKVRKKFFRKRELKKKDQAKNGHELFLMPIHSLILNVSDPNKMFIDKEYLKEFERKVNMEGAEKVIEEHRKRYIELKKEEEAKNPTLEIKEWIKDKNEITELNDKYFNYGIYEANAITINPSKVKKQYQLYIRKQQDPEKEYIVTGRYLNDELNKILNIVGDFTKIKAPLLLQVEEPRRHPVSHKPEKFVIIEYQSV